MRTHYLRWSSILAALIVGFFVYAGRAEADAGPVAQTLPTDGKTLAYFKVGSGPALVIVHGVGGHKEDWQAVAAALAPTHTVYAIDMLGFGGSSKTGDDLSMPVQARAVKTLLRHEHLAKTEILGNSVGGWVAATFAAQYPKLVTKLVLVDVAGFKVMFEGPPPVNFDPNSVEEMQKLIAICVNSDFAHSREFAQKAYDNYLSSGEKAISATWGKSLVKSPRLEELLPKIKAPTLVVWGGDDHLFPVALADAFTAQIKGAQKAIVPNAGHFPQIDNPSGFLAAVTPFLNP